MGSSGIGGMVGGLTGGDKKASSSGTDAAMVAIGEMKKNVGLSQDYSDSMTDMSNQFNQMGQDTLDSWEEMFGGVEQNLSQYYNSLDPVKFAQQTKTSLSEHLDTQLKQYTDTMAARGLMSSGMRSQAEKETAYQKATGNAAADMAAPEQVAQIQTSWLNRGDQQETVATNQLKTSADILGMGLNAETNANIGVANAITGAGNQAVNKQNQQNSLDQQKSQTGMDFLGGAAGALAGGMGAPKGSSFMQGVATSQRPVK